MKIAAAAIVIGFILYPIVYNVPLAPDAYTLGRVAGGGVTFSLLTYVVLLAGVRVWRSFVGRQISN